MESTSIDWKTPEGRPALSVICGKRYALDTNGGCHDTGDFSLQERFDYYREGELGERAGYIRPSVLKRDIDLHAWRGATDVVVQGSARVQQPTSRLLVELTCVGERVGFKRQLLVHGNRRVERGPRGFRLSEAEPFECMPLRYDKAYGGTDELARARSGDRRRDLVLFRAVGADEDREWSEFSYPRNPAGKGYVIENDTIDGQPWPNLEFPDETLSLEHLAAPWDAWGRRPYPACFDWFPHAWFPRIGFLGVLPRTADARVPTREVQLGLFPADLNETPPRARPQHYFSQCAHPYLWRDRLFGDERIEVSALGADGAALVVQLPRVRPSVSVGPLGKQSWNIPAELDLVFIDAEAGQLTLLWRVSVAIDEQAGQPARQARPYSIHW